MKIINTAIFLIITLLIVPVFSYYLGEPLGDEERNVLNLIFKVLIFVAIYCFCLGELTKNYSQVDKLWSIIPIAYTWIIAYQSGFSPRLIIMACLVSVWGIRLTYNFSRHSGYSLKFWSGKEDYRWEVLRKKPEFNSKWRLTLFNLFFISGYQNILLLLITLPALISFQFSNTPLGLFDYIVAFLMVSFILLETIADNQHWKFQSKKWSLIHAKKELTGQYKKGFYNKGLWRYMRHPNYFAEQGIWVCFYLFGVSASKQWINWSVIGCLLLIILFKSSSDFSEEISAGKYPEYKEYQKRTPRFIPFLKRKN